MLPCFFYIGLLLFKSFAAPRGIRENAPVSDPLRAASRLKLEPYAKTHNTL